MTIKKTKDGSLHHGHRERMRNKLMTCGVQVFETYELFEMLLYSQIRYRDTNDIAKRLFKTFKTTDGILTKTPEELQSVDGIGSACASFIAEVGKASTMLDLTYKSRESVTIKDFKEGGEYALRYFKNSLDEDVLLLLLDNKLSVIKEVVIHNVKFGTAAIKPKDFVNKAFQYRASVAMIAYNRPYGSAFATQADYQTSKALAEALGSAGIHLAETYIVCGNKYMGLISSNRYITFSQSPDLLKFYKGNGWDITALVLGASDAREENEASGGGVLGYLSALLTSLGKKEGARQAATALMEKYSILRDIVAAPPEELTEFADISFSQAQLLNIIGYITSRRITELFVPRKVYSRDQIIDYLKAVFIGANVEKIYALFLGASGELKACEFISSGSVNCSFVNTRGFVELALKHDAKEIILAHNHPGGSTEPSQDDIMFTSQLKNALYNIGIHLTAHYIVAGNSCDPMSMS